jgi:hypothetical protein
MSGYGAATAGSNRKIFCKHCKDLHIARTSLTATTKCSITAVHTQLTLGIHTYEERKRRDRKKKGSKKSRKRNERKKNM